MIKNLLENWWMPLVKGIILLILSILVFGNPEGTILGVSLYISFALLFTGTMLTISAISLRSKINNWGWRLAEGLIDIFIGFILFSNPALTALLVSFMIGFWFMFYGITSLSDSFGLKDAKVSNWWVGLLWGILSIIFGFWIMFRPFAGVITIVTLLGTFFMIAGFFNIIFSLVLRRIKKNIED